MSVKVDKFTWSVVAIVVLLLVGAVITVNLTGGGGYGEPEYLDENPPEAAVFNGFVANVKQDNQALDRYYSQAVLEGYRKNNSTARPYSGANFYVDTTPRRLRILETKMQDADRAQVTFSVDRYSGGGPFGSGNTWSNTQTVPVILEEGIWKIDMELFWF